LRLFLAITIPVEVVGALSAAQADVRALLGAEGIRYVRPEHFHFTLKFLGEQTIARAYRVVDVVREYCLGQTQFDVELGGVGAFPNADRASVVWIGAAEGADRVVACAKGLDAALARQGFARENKPPKAHVTIARVKGYEGERSVGRHLHRLSVGTVGKFTVDGVALMQSHLLPSGPQYAVVERFAFATERVPTRLDGPYEGGTNGHG
jgi:2'-5' RNA ligase